MPSVLGFAVVGSDGTLLHSSGVTKVVHSAVGSWNIFFDFSVANACEVASIAHFQTPAWITAYGEPVIGPNEVSVWTGIYETVHGGNGDVLFAANADLTFQLLVVG
jgi:hypothetical protein